MKINAVIVKEKLKSIINTMSENKNKYVKNPLKDFTRNRKITFENVIMMNISMGKSTITKDLMEWYEYDVKMPTTSAFIQQRDKILPSAYEELFYKFTNSFEKTKNFEGYRLLAVDGSDLHIPTNKNDVDSYFETKGDAKNYNLLHLNALYDLCNKSYEGMVVQPRRNSNENQALISMMQSSNTTSDDIFTLDRGYESYNNIAHFNKENLKFIIRIKDKKGIITKINVPNTDEFDINVTLLLTRKQTKEIKSNPDKFRFLPSNANFDFLEKGSSEFFEISFRVVRFKLTEDTYETLITNLDDKFTPEKLKEIYHLRWGIETSFRELKYNIGLINLHSKCYDSIFSEIFSRLIMYNFSMLIAVNTQISTDSRKLEYQINFANAIHICVYFLRLKKEITLDIEAFIAKFILPVRQNQSFVRRKTPKSSANFVYR